MCSQVSKYFEMQQQLELASSKCGNLQKQLEIVKDKVVNSSTTHLPLHFNNSHQLHDEKENKAKNGVTSINFDGTFGNDDDHISTLSSSSDDPNDESGNADIIKVFYERLGQLEHPKGQVELSDVTSENDLDIDQLLSSVDINEERSEFDDAKSSIGPKKRSNVKQETKILKNKKIKLKTIRKPNPYEAALSKIAKTPTKNKRPKNKNKISTKKSGHVLPGDNRNPSVLGDLGKQVMGGKTLDKQNDRWSENEKEEKRILGKCRSKRALQSDHSPTSDLRKTKSSTVAEKNGSFNGNRSLTRLIPKTSSASEKHHNAESKVQEKTAPPNDLTKPAPEANSILAAILNDKLFQRRAKEMENFQSAETEREMQKKRNDQSVQNEPKTNGQEAKNAPRFDLISPKMKTVFTVTNKKTEKQSVPSISRQNNQKLASNILVTKPADKIRVETKPTVLYNKSAKPFGNIPDGPPSKSECPNGVKETNFEKARDILNNKMSKIKNGFVQRHYAADDSKTGNVKSKIVKEVENLKKTWPGDQKRDEIEKKPVDRARTTNHPSLLRTNSQSTMQTYVPKKQEMPKIVQPINTKSSASAFPIVHYKDNEFEVDPFELNQFKKMKDAVMKFNTIPFIVGQSTSKSYHLGLNIQQTYSLFKQTPSMMALKVQNGKPRGVGCINGSSFPCGTSVSGKSLSTRGGARGGNCPACDPVPDPSPEQLEDPWAVPQDSETPVVKICTCLPKRIISFDQVLNQLYFSEMNLRLHPGFLPNKDSTNGGQGEENEPRDKMALAHRGTNSLYYTKFLRKIQCLKDNLLA